MKCKPVLFGLSAVLAMVILIAGTACATPWIQWGTGPQIYLTKVEIPLWERMSPLEQYVWQLGDDWYGGFDFILDGDVPNHIIGVGGGDPGDFIDEFSQPIYVRIGQQVTNVGTEKWGDFHIRTYDGGYPYKLYGSWWPSDWNMVEVDAGWDFTRDPGGETWVMPGQTLFDEFWLRVDPGVNEFTIDKWPTVPEPASLLVLGGSLLSLGGIALRRIRK